MLVLMDTPRESVRSQFIRHGLPEGVGEAGAGAKPASYEAFCAWLTGDDIPIDAKDTAERIRKAMFAGKINAKEFSSIVTSTQLRAMQTAECIQALTGNTGPVYQNPLFREVKIPAISKEVFDACKDLADLRVAYLTPFLEGSAVIDETPVDAYRRAEEALVFFHGVCNLTTERPLIVSHNTFGRFLQLAINHQGERLTDEEVKNIIRNEFMQTKSAAFVEGPVLETTSEGKTVIIQ